MLGIGVTGARRWGGLLAGVMMATGLTASIGVETAAWAQNTSGESTGESAATRQFDIPKQPLATALTLFGQQAGLQVSVDSALVQGLTSPGISGSMPPSEALPRMLAGTGLGYRITAGTVTLEKLPPGASGSIPLPALTVSGQNSGETATGPVQGYVAHQSATATKTDTSLLETPQAISVIGRDQVQAQSAQSLVDVLHYTPGVQAGHNPVDNRFDSILIRGFQPTLFLDGLQLPFGAGQFGRPKVDPFGLERIEVLRGPSSDLYGQVPPGGLVNMVSLRPSEEPLHFLDLQGSSFGQGQGEFDFSGPLDKDGTFLYRLTGLYHNGGTQIDHVNDERIMIAPAFTWKPDEDTTLTFLSQYQHDDGGVEIQFLPAQGTLLSNPHGSLPIGTFEGEPDFNDFKRTQYWLGYQFEHRFDDTWTFRQNLRYADLDTSLKSVIGNGLQADMETLNRAAFYVPEDARNVTLDNQMQANFDTGPLAHTALLGVDYRWDESDFKRGVGAAPPINVFDPNYGADISTPDVSTHTGQKQDQIGVYLQDQIALDHWRLTLSGRHDWVDTTTEDFLANTDQHQNSSAFSGRAGLNYVFDFGLSPYVSYARSFQPTIGTSFDSTAFKPTTGTQYEAGIKYQPNGTNLALNAAVFTLTQKNVVTPDTATGHTGFNVQEGEVRSRGIELDATASLAEGLNLVAAYTYTDAEVTQSNGLDDGKRVITVPKNQASLWLDYTLQQGDFTGLGFGGGVRYFGATYGDAGNTLHIPGYTLVDAMMRYDLGEISPKLKGAKFSVNASNIFNKKYVATCTGLTACYYGTERLVTANLSYSW